MTEILGTAAADTLIGSSGNDFIVGYGGNDRILTGSGVDYVDAGDGNDEINGYFTDATFSRYSYNSYSGSKTILGGNGDDFVYGGSGDDFLSGDAGNDFLIGADGNDSLSGGAGNDLLYGGAGDDVYFVTNRHQAIVDTSGLDTAYISANFAKLPSSIENKIYLDDALALPYWIDALLPNEAAGLSYLDNLGSSKTYKYCFPDSLPAYDTNSADARSWSAFSPIQQVRAEEALAYISSVFDLSFQRTSVAAADNTISFANNAQSTSSGYAFYPDGTYFIGSDVFLDNSKASPNNTTFQDGTYGAYTLIHELGHALGLEHPFSSATSNGAVADPPYLSGSEDSSKWTVMSYSYASDQFHFQYSPLDIAALQYLYGPSKTARAGNDSYVISSSDSNFVWDGAGIDTITAAQCGQGCTLYLEPGYWGYVGATKAAQITAPGQETVNFGSVIENLIGSAYADNLFGTDGANFIDGGAGNDTLHGGCGNDTLIGGEGIDTLVIHVSTADVLSHASELQCSPGHLAQFGSSLGICTVSGIERVELADAMYGFDTLAPDSLNPQGGKLWQVEALYGAYFGYLPDKQMLSVWTVQADKTATMAELGQKMLDAYTRLYSTEEIIASIYSTLTGTTISDGVAHSYAQMIGVGKPYVSLGELFAWAANLDINTVKLVGISGSIQVLDASYFS